MTQILTTKIKNRHGLNMAVLVEIPAAPPPRGLFVFCHGFTSGKDRSTPSLYAQIALKNRLTSLRFDTTHSSEGGGSDGLPELATITSFLEDLEDVIAWAMQQEWYQEPFILGGSSLGGIAALEYTHRFPSHIKALAPVSTVVSGKLSLEAHQRYKPDKLKEWQTTGFHPMENATRPDGFMYVPWSHMEDRQSYDALSYAAEINIPTFQVVGSKDQSCPPDHQKMLYDALGTKDKELHIIEGSPHTIGDQIHQAEVKSHFDAWLKKII